MLITLVNYCYFHSSFREVLDHSFAILGGSCLRLLGNGDLHCKMHALRCVSLCIVVCEMVCCNRCRKYVTQVGGA